MRPLSRQRRALFCKMRLLVFILSAGLLANMACTRRQAPLPDPKKYEEDGKLMINVAHKLAEEPDAKKLQSVAAALSTTRTIDCQDYVGECNHFGQFLTYAVNSAKGGDITPSARVQMRKLADELQALVAKGQMQLRKELESARRANSGN